MSKVIYQQRAALLKLRDRIALDEAPYLVLAELGGMYDDAVKLVVEAAQLRRFPAEIVPSINLWTGNETGTVDSIKSTAATTDLMAWLATLRPNATEYTNQTNGAPLVALVEETQQGEEQTKSEAQDGIAADDELAALFDPVTPEALETKFPGDWTKWANRAKREGLDKARQGRKIFNPYRAALWWLHKHPKEGWALDRVLRTLVHFLPARSRDSKHLMLGELD